MVISLTYSRYQYPRAQRYHKLIYPRGLVSRCRGRAAQVAAAAVRGHHDGLDSPANSVPGTVRLARAVTELLQPGDLQSVLRPIGGPLQLGVETGDAQRDGHGSTLRLAP